MSNVNPGQQFQIPTGLAGAVLTGLFAAGILFFPGQLYSVMFGGLVGFVGLGVCIMGIVKNSGRIAGLLGVGLLIFGWAYNTLVIGRL